MNTLTRTKQIASLPQEGGLMASFRSVPFSEPVKPKGLTRGSFFVSFLNFVPKLFSCGLFHLRNRISHVVNRKQYLSYLPGQSSYLDSCKETMVMGKTSQLLFWMSRKTRDTFHLASSFHKPSGEALSDYG